MPYNQILRLFQLLNDRLIISCDVDPDEPLVLTLCDIIREMKKILELESIQIKDIRLIGGAATYVISSSDSSCFQDIDIVFSLNGCNSLDMMDKIRESVLTAIRNLLTRYGDFSGKDPHPERYIKKQVCVQNSKVKDYWSLFCLGSSIHLSSDIVELKFANSIERQYECSVDSFQIVLDPVLHFIEKYGRDRVTKDLYPTVVLESVWGCLKNALDHLYRKYIVIENPEEIRGGGLLKYCKLLVEGFKPHPYLDIQNVEKYMCSRFFIDFPMLSNQQDKIFSYMENHFPADLELYLVFLEQLSKIVRASSFYNGIDRLRFVVLIDSLIEHIVNVSSTHICVHQFNDLDKWTVGEITFGSYGCAVGTSSTSSSIGTPTDLSPD